MDKESPSIWASISFWKRSAGWVTGMAAVLLIWLTFDTIPQMVMGTDEDMQNGVTKRVPSPTVINYKITYEMSEKRGHEVPVIGEKEEFFGRSDYSYDEALALLNLGKLTIQAKNCINCHTFLGNGAYYAPDLTKAWLDPRWEDTGRVKEEAMAEFLIDPSTYTHSERRMPRLGITEEEAKGVVAFLKHMSSIDTNGFPRNFGKIKGAINAK